MPDKSNKGAGDGIVMPLTTLARTRTTLVHATSASPLPPPMNEHHRWDLSLHSLAFREESRLSVSQRD